MTTVINKYFRHISALQEAQFAALKELYGEWNAKINVISRKDIDNLYVHHVLHSLGIARFVTFRTGTKVLDVGTGGGFPGIPLAILFPDVLFHLIDGIAKKIMVTQSVIDALELKNVTARQCRMEEEKCKYDFAVSRAVMPFPELAKRIRKNIDDKQNNAIPNGLICLKGGDTAQETAPFARRAVVQKLGDYFEETFFMTKKIIYLPL